LGAGALAGGLLGETLDYPRQAIANLFSGDWEKALPGLAGLLATGGLAATGVGLPAAIGLGTGLVGGLSQFGAKQIDPEEFQAPSREDVTEKLGLDRDNSLATFAVGALTDPLTYAGGLGLEKLGARGLGALGEKAGLTMEQIAPEMSAYSGFGWHSKLRDLMEQVKDHPNLAGLPMDSRVAFNPYLFMGQDPEVLQKIAQEVPRGGKLLGVGTESAAFTNPDTGGILKLTMPQDFSKAPFEVPEMLQQSRRINFADPLASGPTPRNLGITVAHEPRLVPGTMGGDLYEQQLPALQAALKQRGLEFWDYKPSNVGFDPVSGKMQIYDPGAVRQKPPLLGPGPNWDYPAQQVADEPGAGPQGFLQRMFMAPIIRRDIRRELAEQVGRPAGAYEEFLRNVPQSTLNVQQPMESSMERKIAELEQKLGLKPGEPIPPQHMDEVQQFFEEQKGRKELDQLVAEQEQRFAEAKQRAQGLFKSSPLDLSGAASAVNEAEEQMAREALARQMANPPGPSTLERLQRGGEGGGPSPLTPPGPPAPTNLLGDVLKGEPGRAELTPTTARSQPGSSPLDLSGAGLSPLPTPKNAADWAVWQGLGERQIEAIERALETGKLTEAEAIQALKENPEQFAELLLQAEKGGGFAGKKGLPREMRNPPGLSNMW
jgi:hypothetical protein